MHLNYFFNHHIKTNKMKKRICFNKLTVSVFIVALMLGAVNYLQAQDITTYQYRHVDPDKAGEFIKRETTYWSKVARKAIDNGKMSFWALLEKVGGTEMGTASNFLFVNSWPDLNADLSSVFDPTKLFPGIPMSKISTDAMGTVTGEVFVINDGWQEVAKVNPATDYQYVLFNYHNSSNPSEFNRLEKDHWGPFIKAAMDNKQVDQKAWGNSIVLMPTGGTMKFNCLSIDLYSNIKSALNPTWSPTITFPNAGLDSLQKISLDPPARVLYRIVKVETKLTK
jgi:hypothetical protein